jgi:hypothetical protein
MGKGKGVRLKLAAAGYDLMHLRSRRIVIIFAKNERVLFVVAFSRLHHTSEEMTRLLRVEMTIVTVMLGLRSS